MSKDIVLVQPNAGTFELLGTRLPIGLLSIASLPHQRGYKIQVIDQRTDKNWRDSLVKALEHNGSTICGITAMTGKQITNALEASRIAKIYGATVIWGGVHATLLPEQTLDNPNIDIVVLREGDITFMEVVEALEKGNLKDVKGIYYKENGRIIKNPPREFIKDLDGLPELPYELIDIDRYVSMDIEGKSLDFVTSRGCPFKCSFCYNHFFNESKWRAFSAEETVSRLKRVVEEYNIKTIYFQDDNFCSDLKRLERICEGIIREKLDIRWGTLGLRADTAMRMDDDFLGLMERSGCVNVDIGAESGNERILKMIDKGISVDELIAVNKKLSRFPFLIKYTYVIGIPTETRGELRDTVNLALRLARDNGNAYNMLIMYMPYPRTPMYDLAIREGFEEPINLEEWGHFNGNDWYFHFKSWMSPKQIRELNSVTFTSYFSNRNIKYKINKPLLRLLFDLYHPIARFRFENHFHHLPIDSMMSRLIFEKN